MAYPRRNAVGTLALPVREHSAGLRHSIAALLIVLAALSAALALTVVAPDYFTARGFPLDDAWIHAVYGRELARSGTWAYNPGIPATGSTSPLWSVVLAVIHLGVDAPQPAALLIKWTGFALHVLTALLLYFACAGAGVPAPMRLLGALLVALHPDLVSASVSGMEVPLATLAAAALVWATARGGFVWYTALAAGAFLARPEVALIAVILPLILTAANPRAARLIIAAGLGTAGAAAGLAIRNVRVSGLPLPATFYAKVGHGADPFTALQMGFGGLLPELAIAPMALCLGTLSLIALRARPASAGRTHTSIAAFVAGLVYCAASFLLITPHDPGAFYHQRYILPALPLLIAPATGLAGTAFRAWLPGLPRVPSLVVGCLLTLGLLLHMPGRYHRLANDARNIDDVQVAVGRFLAAAASSDIVWAVDAGAVRYFGNAFVVDLMGLNTPALLDESAQSYLDAHPPRYLEVVPLWSDVDGVSARRLPRITFAASTRYTVTRFAAMQTHHLLRCDPAVVGEITVRTATRSFRCAP